MSAPNPAHLKAQFQALSLSRHVGRVMGVQGGVIRIQGLAQVARIGDRLELKRNTGSSLHGEVSAGRCRCHQHAARCRP